MEAQTRTQTTSHPPAARCTSGTLRCLNSIDSKLPRRFVRSHARWKTGCTGDDERMCGMSPTLV
jgi:hypothetical protein